MLTNMTSCVVVLNEMLGSTSCILSGTSEDGSDDDADVTDLNLYTLVA